MSSFVIAFFMAAGASAWVYNKSQERTGNNTDTSIKITAVVGVMTFIVTLTVLSIVGNYMEDGF